VAGETYLRRINCEYRDYLADQLAALGLAARVGFQSEREDWIQMMVAAGFGVCFLPEFSPTIPGVRIQPVTGPEVVREVSLVSMSGRRFSPAVILDPAVGWSVRWVRGVRQPGIAVTPG
jgi:LysR family transcriptional regulator, hydrogen peroxide-inducible genes activator